MSNFFWENSWIRLSDLPTFLRTFLDIPSTTRSACPRARAGRFKRRSSSRSKSALSAMSSRSSAESLTSSISSFSSALMNGNSSTAVTMRTMELTSAISTGPMVMRMKGNANTAFSA